MDIIEKLLRKISARDRAALLAAMEELEAGADIDRLRPIKLQGAELYRVRMGDFRIIFHKENGRIVIDSVRMRNEKTYR